MMPWPSAARIAAAGTLVPSSGLVGAAGALMHDIHGLGYVFTTDDDGKTWTPIASRGDAR